MPADDISLVAHSTQAPSSQHRSDPDAEADVLDVPQVARLLRVGRNTVYALVARNRIPHRRLGKAIRFSRRAVMAWLSSSLEAKSE